MVTAARFWALPPVVIATASRAFSVALVWLANALGHPHRLDPFVAWDAGWYLQVAKGGYHATPVTLSGTNVHYDFAFFPLWPAVIRLSTLGVLPAAATSVVLANLLFIAATVLLWKLLAERFEPPPQARSPYSPLARPPTSSRWPTPSPCFCCSLRRTSLVACTLCSADCSPPLPWLPASAAPRSSPRPLSRLC